MWLMVQDGKSFDIEKYNNLVELIKKIIYEIDDNVTKVSIEKGTVKNNP